jgi:hypothetical protein
MSQPSVCGSGQDRVGSTALSAEMNAERLVVACVWKEVCWVWSFGVALPLVQKYSLVLRAQRPLIPLSGLAGSFPLSEPDCTATGQAITRESLR